MELAAIRAQWDREVDMLAERLTLAFCETACEHCDRARALLKRWASDAKFVSVEPREFDSIP